MNTDLCLHKSLAKLSTKSLCWQNNIDSSFFAFSSKFNHTVVVVVVVGDSINFHIALCIKTTVEIK